LVRLENTFFDVSEGPTRGKRQPLMRKKGEKPMDLTEEMKKRRDELLAQKEKIDTPVLS